jgi:hypothetical protein
MMIATTQIMNQIVMKKVMMNNNLDIVTKIKCKNYMFLYFDYWTTFWDKKITKNDGHILIFLIYLKYYVSYLMRMWLHPH